MYIFFYVLTQFFSVCVNQRTAVILINPCDTSAQSCIVRVNYAIIFRTYYFLLSLFCNTTYVICAV